MEELEEDDRVQGSEKGFERDVAVDAEHEGW